MILAAGLGTRLAPFTHHHPKALARVGDKTLLELTIRKLQAAGIFDIVVNVHHFADQIISELQANNGFGSNYSISDESAEVLETGGGLLFAKSLLEDSENFIVINVDIISNINVQNLINAHLQNNAVATLAVQQRTSSRYLLFDSDQQLVGWKNEAKNEYRPADLDKSSIAATKAFSGIQVLHKSIFELIQRKGKFSLIDVYLDVCTTQKIVGYDHTSDVLLDVGKPEALAEAIKYI